ncbi:MAG: DNA cytosine methyltransferase, partial [Proteobacteria bacterium]|nr:DNA cytosine methyltransferase [Pseudomonadota bacterium]
TELRVKRLIIENVWEFTGWGPVDPDTGKPIKDRKGEYFTAWIETIRRLGFEPEWHKLNAADYGGATTRKRFILKARSDRRPVRWAPITHAKDPEPGSGLKRWRGACEVINFDNKGKSIFGRKKPLAANTLLRIYAGVVNHDWPAPYVVVLRNHMAAQGIDVPLPALAANGQHVGLATPIVGNLKKDASPAGLDDPLPTMATHASLFTAEGIVLAPHGGPARSTDQPLPTITTGGAGSDVRQGCARPMLVEPFVLSQGAGGAARNVSEPMPTIPGGGAHALISPYYSNGDSVEGCHGVDEPLPAIPTKDRFGLIVGVTNAGGNGKYVRPTSEPLGTVTTAKGGEFALVTPLTHRDSSDRTSALDEPLPTVTGANRGELAFITAQHGEREGQAPRVHSIDLPTPTIAATGHTDLVVAGEHYDILFRMLEPPELAAAMGLSNAQRTYKFVGTKTQVIKQIGNAVSVEMMDAEVEAICSDAAPRRPAQPRFLEAAE